MLVGREGRRRVVRAANRAAVAAGVRVGMAATQAHALVRDLLSEPHDPAADAAALQALALWALRRYAPIVAVDAPDGLVIDATGAAHLRGGEAGLLADLLGRLAEAGIEARAAMADSWGAAHAVARFAAAPGLVVDPGRSGAALARLPVAALRLPDEIVAGLKVLGFMRIGELAAQPRAPLALRFGPEPGRRLDQAMGRLDEPIAPVSLPAPIAAQRAYVEPISTAETIARHLDQLVAELCVSLEAAGMGARRLDLICHRVDAMRVAVRVGTVRAVREPARLAKLLKDRIETIDPGFGIERMELIATVAEPLGYRATSTLDQPEMADISGLIDTLTNRVGAEHLYRIAPVESDIPERSTRRIAPLSAPGGAGWPPHWPRPARLLRPPEPISTLAMLPDHPPVQFTWRGVRRRVRRADGPERIYGEWGKRDAEMSAVRDYFQLEDEAGERFWVFRSGDGESVESGDQSWFLHGVFG